jgi:hypothetical protein
MRKAEGQQDEITIYDGVHIATTFTAVVILLRKKCAVRDLEIK